MKLNSPIFLIDKDDIIKEMLDNNVTFNENVSIPEDSSSNLSDNENTNQTPQTDTQSPIDSNSDSNEGNDNETQLPEEEQEKLAEEFSSYENISDIVFTPENKDIRIEVLKDPDIEETLEKNSTSKVILYEMQLEYNNLLNDYILTHDDDNFEGGEEFNEDNYNKLMLLLNKNNYETTYNEKLNEQNNEGIILTEEQKEDFLIYIKTDNFKERFLNEQI
ncbi:MAG: hypothetical protein PHV15_01985 [Thomasclavelia ramosa]|nr:hypothetical protein [Thomasclavelia ramosa]